MQQKRSKTQLVAEILTTCQGDGTNKTRIVYPVNTNFTSVRPYLDLLTKKGLLEAIQGDFILYKTTAKGKLALKSLRAIEEIYS